MEEALPVLTYQVQNTPPWFARMLLRPVGKVYFGLAGAGLAWILWECRVPNPFGAVIGLFLGCVGFGAVALLRLLLQAVLTKVYKRPWQEFRRGSWRYGVVLGLAGFAWTMAHFEVPAWIAFQWSKGAMQAEAEALLKAHAGAPAVAVTGGKSLGVLPIQSIELDVPRKTVTFWVEGSGFLTREGYTYCGSGGPPSTMHSWGNMAPPWYRAWETW